MKLVWGAAVLYLVVLVLVLVLEDVSVTTTTVDIKFLILKHMMYFLLVGN